MIHAAAPHFLWPFAVRYAVHQLNLWPHVSLPETLPTLGWTGKVGDASLFRFYHPTWRRVLPSQDVTFDESVPFYLLFPYRSAPLPPPPLFLAPSPPLSCCIWGAEPAGSKPEGAESEGARFGGAEPGGAEPVGAEPAGAEPGGAKPGGAEPGVAESEGAESGGAEPRGTTSCGGPAGASPRLGAAKAGDSADGGTGAGGTRATSLGGTGVLAGARGPGGAGEAGPGGTGAGGAGGAAGVLAGGTGAGAAGGTEVAGLGGARPGGTGAAGAGGATGVGAGDPRTGAAGPGGAHTGGTGAASAGGAIKVGAGDHGAGDTRAGGAGPGGAGAVGAGSEDIGRPRPYFVPQLQQVLSLPSSTRLTPPIQCPPPDLLQPPLQPSSPLPAPSPYTKQTGGLTKRREPVSHPALPVCVVRTSRRVPRPRPPPVPGTHHMAIHPESDLVRVASPNFPSLIATDVTDHSFESAAASALVDELVDFAAACRLDYAASLVADSESDYPPSVGGECALGTDVLEDRQEDFECFAAAVPHLVSVLIAPEGDPDAPDIPTPRSYAEAITGPYSSEWQIAMDADMPSWKSTSTYVDVVPPPGAHIVDGMWIFKVKRPPGSPPALKARHVARGFSQRQGFEFFQTFSPTPKMTTLQESLDEESWLRRPPDFTGSFLDYTCGIGVCSFDCSPVAVSTHRHIAAAVLRRRVLQCFNLRYSLPQSSALPTGHLLSAPPSDESVEPSGPYPELVGCLITSGMGLVLGGRGPVVLTGHANASWVDVSAMQQSSQGYTFSLGSGSVSWRSTRSSSVLRSSCEAEIYAGAMAAQELRWLTYLLTDLGERPRSSPVLYVDNKAMIALCQEHRLEQRTKHIALRYFLARELQQRGQLRLAYVATRANTADIFTKALPPGDHQRFCTVLGLVPTLPHLLSA
ncbi:unnamed protein product [Closterium sp. NIES-53]